MNIEESAFNHSYSYLLYFFTEGALVFTQEPANTLYFQEGSTANLTWTYTVDNRTTELARIIWSIFNKTESLFVVLILEEKDGTILHNRNTPPTYGPERVSKEGQASLVIKNVTFKDSTTYECRLDGETGVVVAPSSVEVIVTGMPEWLKVNLAINNYNDNLQCCSDISEL